MMLSSRAKSASYPHKANGSGKSSEIGCIQDLHLILDQDQSGGQRYLQNDTDFMQ
jgi:hypothetical protein